MPRQKRTVTAKGRVANRDAVLESTDPRTPPGKQRSSLNALRADIDSKGLPGFGLALPDADSKGLLGFGDSVADLASYLFLESCEESPNVKMRKILQNEARKKR